MHRFTYPAPLFALLTLSCASLGGGAKNAGLPDPLSRIEILSRILVLEDQRTLGGSSLPSFLDSEDPSVRRRAAIAMGRIADPLAVPKLVSRLQDPVVEVRRSVAFALGLIGRTEAVSALQTSLADTDPPMRGRAAEALSRIGDSLSSGLIADALRKALPRASGSILRIRGDDPGKDDDPWIEARLELFALARLKNVAALASVLIADNAPTIDWWAGVWAAGRVADPALEPVLVAGASAEDPYIRGFAAKGLGNLKSARNLGLLRKLSEDRDPSVVVEALRALAQTPSPESARIVSTLLDSPNSLVRREALLALAALPTESRFRPRVIENIGNSDPWIRSAAWRALVKIDANEVGLVLSTVGSDPEWTVRASLAEALGEVGAAAAPVLNRMLTDPDARVVRAALGGLARARGEDAIPMLQEYLGKEDMGFRETALSALNRMAGLDDGRRLEVLQRALDASRDDGDVEVRMAVVNALEKNSASDSRVLLRRIAGDDSSRAVRQRALNILNEGFAPPEPRSLRVADARRLVAVYDPGDATLVSPRAVITTRLGRIELSLDLVDAPLTTMSFVRLAQSGFYDGLTFHRIVPAFVAQGGDPRGDGYGGPGSTIRCEYNEHPYGRGAVGMALSGKDTGGSQFFITTAPQPHLDGAYTLFGHVVSGMDVVDRLRPGDAMERVEVFDGREGR